ncbi:MAG: right-handed parallel beta-helix repeat-containing protein [Candidatus Thiodiazotropha sp. (ex Rostrolucina anterorostrata)]|nr:right-handed parallel beta-helix repeat-containing protein [Candidatus Thiodiazotropha sp. (ex Rostrolucina anterorostrata)]
MLRPIILKHRITSKLLSSKLTTSKLVLAQPEWVLFERMEYADKLYNHPTPINYANQQKQFEKRRQTIIAIADNDFTENTLVSAIKSLRNSGGEIHLPAGELILENTLNITQGISLKGINGRTELVFKDCDYGISIQGTAGNKLDQVEIHDIRLYHQGDNRFCAALFARHTQALHLESVDIISPRAVGILLADQVYQTKLVNCRVQHAGLVGFMFIRDVIETLMTNCSAEYCQQSGVFLTDLKLPDDIDPLDFSAQLDYTNHTIGNFAPFAADDPSPYRTDIINCVFSHNRKMGITTDGVAYLKVINCVMAHNDCEGITIDNGAWGCSIQNCHIFNNGWRGLQHVAELGTDYVSEMGLMEDGSSKAKLPGISLDNAAYTRVENNHIECNWGDGVKLVRAAYESSITGNLIENNNRGMNDRFHYFGILVGVAKRQHCNQYDFASCNNYIGTNTILGEHFSGIHLMARVTGNIVEKNSISGASCQSIEVHALFGNMLVET